MDSITTEIMGYVRQVNQKLDYSLSSHSSIDTESDDNPPNQFTSNLVHKLTFKELLEKVSQIFVENECNSMNIDEVFEKYEDKFGLGPKTWKTMVKRTLTRYCRKNDRNEWCFGISSDNVQNNTDSDEDTTVINSQSNERNLRKRKLKPESVLESVLSDRTPETSGAVADKLKINEKASGYQKRSERGVQIKCAKKKPIMRDRLLKIIMETETGRVETSEIIKTYSIKNADNQWSLIDSSDDSIPPNLIQTSKTVTHHPDLICQEQRSQTEPLNKERLFPENPATKLDLKMRTKLRRVRKLVRNKINQVNAMLDEREILDDKINKFEAIIDRAFETIEALEAELR